MFNSWQVTAPPHEAPESNIITRMMASPESLLVLSLIKGNIAQAADVIKVWISKRFFFFCGFMSRPQLSAFSTPLMNAQRLI